MFKVSSLPPYGVINTVAIVICPPTSNIPKQVLCKKLTIKSYQESCYILRNGMLLVSISAGVLVNKSFPTKKMNLDLINVDRH